jgi:hypothetical protein
MSIDICEYSFNTVLIADIRVQETLQLNSVDYCMQINLHIQLNLHVHAEKLIHLIQLHGGGGVFRCLLAEHFSLSFVQVCGTVFGISTKKRLFNWLASLGHIFHCLLDLN